MGGGHREQPVGRAPLKLALPPSSASKKPTELGGALELALVLLSRSMRFSIGGCVMKIVLSEPLTLAGTMKNAFMFSAGAQVLLRRASALRWRSSGAPTRARSGGR